MPRSLSGFRNQSKNGVTYNEMICLLRESGQVFDSLELVIVQRKNECGKNTTSSAAGL